MQTPSTPTPGADRELRIRHNMRTIYCENRNGATQQTLFSGPRPPWVPPWYAVVRARSVSHCATWPFLLARRSIKMPPFHFPD